MGSDTFAVRNSAHFQLAMFWILIRGVKTKIETLLINLFHDIQGKFERAIGDVGKSRLRNIFEGMSSHIIDSFELFVGNKVYLRRGEGIEFIVIFKNFIANGIFHDIWVDNIYVNNLLVILSVMSFIAFHKFDTLYWYCEVNLLLQQISLVANLYILHICFIILVLDWFIFNMSFHFYWNYWNV